MPSSSRASSRPTAPTSANATPYGFLPQLATEARGALGQAVERALREAILGLDLQPGAMIDKNAVCERMGVSRYPVSAALAKLAAEGLVEVLPQRGTRVKRIALADIAQHMFIRSALEAETVRRLAGQATPDLMEALQTSLAAQKKAIEEDDQRSFYRLDLQFHETLMRALNYPRVNEAVGTARNSLDRARRLLASRTRHSETLREHTAIVRALKSGDADRAGTAMHTHLDAVAAELRRFARQRPDLFEGT